MAAIINGCQKFRLPPATNEVCIDLETLLQVLHFGGSALVESLLRSGHFGEDIQRILVLAINICMRSGYCSWPSMDTKTERVFLAWTST